MFSWIQKSAAKLFMVGQHMCIRVWFSPFFFTFLLLFFLIFLGGALYPFTWKGIINLVLQNWLSHGKPVFNFILCLYIFFSIVLFNSILFFRMQDLFLIDLYCSRNIPSHTTLKNKTQIQQEHLMWILKQN